MKPRLYLALFFAATVATLVVPSARAAQPPGRKRALLVAVSDYQAPYPSRRDRSAWPNLHTNLDTQNLRDALKQWGFADEDILVLQDLETLRAGQKVRGPGATREGILESFRRHLIEPAQPGDVVVFMFSGHGQLVKDPEGFRVKPDGLDPSIVPYDYISASARDEEERNVRGYDLQPLLKELTEKMREPGGEMKGNVTLVIDSCHSNKISRGRRVAKGRGWLESIDGPLPRPPQGAKGAVVSEGQSHPEASGFQRGGDAALARGYVMMAACQTHESAYEWADDRDRSQGGALIYNFCEALRHATDKTTYRDLFERVSLTIKAKLPEQTPSLEGQIDQRLFNGLASPAPTYPLVKEVRDGMVTLDAGGLHGVTVKSRYALYRPGSDPRDAQNARLAEVEITDVDAYESQARLPEEDLRRIAAMEPAGQPVAEKLRGARAALTAQYYGDQRLRVLLEGTGEFAAALRLPGVPEEQDPFQLIPVNPTRGAEAKRPAHDVRIVSEAAAGANGARELRLLRDNDTPLSEQVGRIPADDQAPATLRKLLRREWRRRLLTHPALTREGSLIDVRVHVVPVVARRQPNGLWVKERDVPDPERTSSGRLVMRAGQAYEVELANTGQVDAYVTVFDLQPDGTIFPIFPDPQKPQAFPNRLQVGQRVRLPGLLSVDRPFGDDIIEVIATTENVAFASLIFSPEEFTARGDAPPQIQAAEATAKGVPRSVDPLARLLMSASTTTRGGRTMPTEVMNWNVRSEIVETRGK